MAELQCTRKKNREKREKALYINLTSNFTNTKKELARKDIIMEPFSDDMNVLTENQDNNTTLKTKKNTDQPVKSRGSARLLKITPYTLGEW